VPNANITDVRDRRWAVGMEVRSSFCEQKLNE
jgi:hypothetical protein